MLRRKLSLLQLSPVEFNPFCQWFSTQYPGTKVIAPYNLTKCFPKNQRQNDMNVTSFFNISHLRNKELKL